jgi:limonene 1,2-monooxygenase
MHLAETKDQAIEDVRYGLDDYFDFLSQTVGSEHYAAAGATFDERLDWALSTGNALVGTPQDAIAKIGELVDASGGNVGAFLIWAHEWAAPAATSHSYELFARHVMPVFQNTTNRLNASKAWVSKVAADMIKKQLAAAAKFIEEHQAEAHPAQDDLARS